MRAARLAAGDMATSALQLDRVVKRYGAVTAVSDLSFDVRPGEMFGLIGPDGAGKTTTIRLLCGLLHADGGTVRVLGHDPVREHAAITRDLGYLSQRFSLYGDLSIDENIAFFAEIHDLWRYEPRRARLLELTNLLPFRTRLADRLSGGMKQKLALACTLIHEPRVILLDEPTTGVDPVSRREFWKLLAEFLRAGHHDSREHAVPRRSRALSSRGAAARRAAARARHAGSAAPQPARPDGRGDRRRPADGGGGAVGAARRSPTCTSSASACTPAEPSVTERRRSTCVVARGCPAPAWVSASRAWCRPRSRTSSSRRLSDASASTTEAHRLGDTQRTTQ